MPSSLFAVRMPAIALAAVALLSRTSRVALIVVSLNGALGRGGSCNWCNLFAR